MKIQKVKAGCRHCGKKTLIRAGVYYTRSKPRIRKRYHCKSCHKYQVIRPKLFLNKKLSIKVIKEIKRLSKAQKPFFNKYDPKKSFNYSSREIVEILRRRKMAFVGKSCVAVYLKEFRENEEQHK